ncbi:MAG TPA: hypothetical protein PLR52_09550 [Bacteroidales bacterium]|nr:hypothetical protein [Bacteroidales bacterium]HPF02953.1 hypothetical protein [Bacteroidales bacterium]HPI68851.1 hypothetical protein [Bacteroidales bacterium]HPR73122.1 hypothetical protein [Bacteroidales bacterium]HRW85179.1 hypothetical protein [Bacteroidales bacterium]
MIGTHSYLALRKTVGWIGILLPFVLIAGTFLLSGEDIVRKNISLYYHSEMRDVFVGALCAIALFLFFYKGYDRWDDMAGNLSGFFALGIAFFPTVREGPYNLSAWIHFISASCFFLVLSVFSLFLFTRKVSSPSKRKVKRNIIYRICGYVMIICLVSILLYMIFLEGRDRQSEFVFWAETVALMAFGISWLTKGGTLYPDIG